MNADWSGWGNARKDAEARSGERMEYGQNNGWQTNSGHFHYSPSGVNPLSSRICCSIFFVLQN